MMPIWEDDHKSIGDSLSDITKTISLDNYPIVKKFTVSGFSAHIKESKTRVVVSVFSHHNRIGLFIFKKNRLGVEASWSAIYKTHQGLGIGKKVYKKIISLYGKIVSSPTLTGKSGHGSFNIYKSLSKRKQVYLMNVKTGTMKPIKVSKEAMRYAVERFVIVA